MSPRSSMRANGSRGARSARWPVTIAALVDRPRTGRDPAAQHARARRGAARGAAGRRDRRRHQPVPRRRPHQGRHRGTGTADHHRQLRTIWRRWSSRRPVRRSSSISTLDAEPRLTAGDDRVRGQARCRGADADQRHHRPAEADRPHLRHAGAQRHRARTGPLPHTDGSPPRRGDRQRTAGAHRRCVPGAAMRRRGQILRAAATASNSSGGPTPCAASSQGGVAGARRVADGAALRSDPARTWPASARSRRAPHRCPPTTPTPSSRSSAFRS